MRIIDLTLCVLSSLKLLLPAFTTSDTSSDTSKIGPRFHRSALHSVYCVLAFAALRARAMFQIYKVKILFSSILIDLLVSTTVGLQLLAPR